LKKLVIPANFAQAFELLNEKLKENNMNLELICAGDYVLQLHGYKHTMDVVAFYDSNTKLNQIIWQVGNELSLNIEGEPWLNNSVSHMNRLPPKEYIESTKQFSNLIVNSLCLDYIVGMKLYSGQERDLDDVKSVIAVEYKNFFEHKDELIEMGFDIDIALLLEAYEKAYGMDWLVDFYRRDSDKLIIKMDENIKTTIYKGNETKKSN
jgi:hypothetical protein